jgi:hypothetical protein
MIPTLESRKRNQYRSKGELTIANLLDQYRIPFKYEPDIYLQENNKSYIWHPDFYLPEYQTVIEYLGLTGNQNYDQMTRRKKRIYHLNHYCFMPVYPETLQKDYQTYIFKSIQTHLTSRSNDFYRKTGYRT